MWPDETDSQNNERIARGSPRPLPKSDYPRNSRQQPSDCPNRTSRKQRQVSCDGSFLRMFILLQT